MELYSIRKTNDWKGISKINNQHFCEPIEYTENSQAWLVWHNGFVVGFCTVEILEANICYLTRAAVDPLHQNKGIHSRMLKVREQFAKRMECNKIITYVSKPNIKSLIGLVRAGYQFYYPEYAYVGNDYYYFLKEL